MSMMMDPCFIPVEIDLDPTLPAASEDAEVPSAPSSALASGRPTPTPTLQSRQTASSERLRVPISERPELVPGDVVGDRYRLEQKVGSGGMGEVWAAVHVTIQTRAAVKVLLPAALQVPDIVARFEREAVLLGRAQGPHVPRVMDFFVDEKWGPVLVTEFVEGQSLADVLKSPLSVEAAVDLGIDLATGLEELHQASVVHRDLKPNNVILRQQKEGPARAVIIDLGVSRLVKDAAGPAEEQITVTDVVVGTLEYMAPEQIISCKEVTPASDLYALGALLFRAVAGAHVFGSQLSRVDLVRAKLSSEAPSLPVRRQDAVARGLAAIVARALERDPARRYHSADEMRADLLRLRETPVDAPPVHPPSVGAGGLLRLAAAFWRGRGVVALMFMTLALVSAVCAHAAP
jgi:serine/threonine protein kinase